MMEFEFYSGPEADPSERDIEAMIEKQNLAAGVNIFIPCKVVLRREGRKLKTLRVPCLADAAPRIAREIKKPRRNGANDSTT